MPKRPINFVLILVAFVLAAWPARGENQMNPNTNILDFSSNSMDQWYAVNDGVMGGASQSAMQVTDQGIGEFSGMLSLENNGGFASVRTAISDSDLSDFLGVELRIKGDGRPYQLRFRTDDRFDGMAYRTIFTVPAGQWTTISLPFSGFEPTFRGRVMTNQPALNTKALKQLIFLLADKEEGPFKLEIEWVRAWPMNK